MGDERLTEGSIYDINVAYERVIRNFIFEDTNE